MLIYCVFSMKISKISDEHFSNYNMLPNGNEEIDLFNLIRVLWAAKIKIVGVILFFACIGFLVSFVLPQKWTSSAVVTPAESVQWSELNKELSKFHVVTDDCNTLRITLIHEITPFFSFNSCSCDKNRGCVRCMTI
jgi:LPS O-antigen subunit length determinant protein (WzzB/FepE family)